MVKEKKERKKKERLAPDAQISLALPIVGVHLQKHLHAHHILIIVIDKWEYRPLCALGQPPFSLPYPTLLPPHGVPIPVTTFFFS